MPTYEPITPHMGAEVFDVDLTDLDAGTEAELKQAFLDYQVLVFRDQVLSRDQHKAFGRLFGTLHVHPSKKQLDTRSDPEIFAINITPETRFANGEAWHTDVSCEPIPPLGSMLYVKELPGPSGGDTLFANMYAVFESLSEPMQEWLRGLVAFHDGRKDLAAYNITLKPGQTYPNAEHPIVIKHPETGREVLFVNRAFTECIVGLSRTESDAVLEMLWRAGETNPRFHCRVRWRPNTLVFWDNRCTWHHAVWDYFPNTRYGERVSICGASAPAR